METDKVKDHKPRRVAVLGAAGGLGQALLEVCREQNISFTAVVRSRPERIGHGPLGSRVAVVPNLAATSDLAAAFAGADAVISAIGVTGSSNDSAALLSHHMKSLAEALKTAGVDRLLLISTLLTSPPGKPPTWPMRFFSRFPGNVGIGAREMLAVAGAIGQGALAGLRWTLVRAGVNSKGKNEPPLALREYDKKLISLQPVSYHAMARWMIEEAAANHFVCEAPAVSRKKSRRTPRR